MLQFQSLNIFKIIHRFQLKTFYYHSIIHLIINLVIYSKSINTIIHQNQFFIQIITYVITLNNNNEFHNK